MNTTQLRRLGLLFFIMLGYIVAGRLGLKLAFVNESTTAVWAPTGIALAAFLILDYRIWPAIFFGALIVNFSISHAFFSSIIIAIGNTLEGVVGAYLLNRFASGAHFYSRSTDVKKFVLYAVTAATFISASIGTLTLIVNKTATGNAWLTFFTWWIGDAVGAIIITPLILLLYHQKWRMFNRVQMIERILYLIAFVGICVAVFGQVFHNHPLGFLLIPLLIWPGMRFSQKESAIASFLIAVIAITMTIQGMGPFVRTYPNDTLLMLQAYIAVITLTGLILAATVAERSYNELKLSEAYDHALEGWSNALDMRDKETEGHAKRVAELSVQLATELGLSKKDLITVRRGALLHDIGKMAIPDSILFKAGPLTDEEWVVMRKHPDHGSALLSHMPYFSDARNIAYCHHEKWDGSGYPQGLKGEDIPLHARIFAVVDVWDAIRAPRRYRQALSDKDALEYLISLSGKHFDPSIIEVFANMVNNAAKSSQQENSVTEFILSPKG